MQTIFLKILYKKNFIYHEWKVSIQTTKSYLEKEQGKSKRNK